MSRRLSDKFPSLAKSSAGSCRNGSRYRQFTVRAYFQARSTIQRVKELDFLILRRVSYIQRGIRKRQSSIRIPPKFWQWL
ncbi:hypothetical protein WP1_261 [Pseudomonas phage WP1]